MPPPTIGQDLLGRGWCTGSVLPKALHAQLNEMLDVGGDAIVKDEDWVIVVSQTCDVVAYRDEAEPFVELLVASPTGQKARKQYVNLRSTRQLDFKPNQQTLPNLVLTAHATANRYLPPRTFLQLGEPDPERVLSDAAIRRLKAWYSLRYGRPAWPDAFNQRLQPIASLILKLLETVQNEVAEIRVALTPSEEELPADRPYTVAIFFVVDEAVFEANPAVRGLIHTQFAEFASLIARCDGIEVHEESDVLSGENFSWQMMQQTDLWDFANLSPLE